MMKLCCRATMVELSLGYVLLLHGILMFILACCHSGFLEVYNTTVDTTRDLIIRAQLFVC